jgi:hypothetical protein
MKIEDFPNLLIVTKLVEPIDRSIKNILESKDHLKPDLIKVCLHGIFVMTVSSMEFMLSDVLKYFLKSFPQKITTSEFKYDKDDFFDNYFNLLERTIDNLENSLSYKSFKDYFGQFLKYLSIEWNEFQESYGRYVQEIKASRNLLLHNNLIINDQYIESAGDMKRSNGKGGKIKIDYDYVVQSIDKIIIFENKLKEHIITKYKEYTKINANKNLWMFMFQSPVMPYEDYWICDKKADRIIAFKEGRYEKALSSTETIRLGLWRAHFTGDSSHIRFFHMRRFDRHIHEKVLFFLSIARDFDFE